MTASEETETSTSPQQHTIAMANFTHDYNELVHTITQRIQTLSNQAVQSTKYTDQTCQEGVIKDADTIIDKLNQLLKECDLLEQEFIKVEQLKMITEDFDGRLKELEKYFAIWK